MVDNKKRETNPNLKQQQQVLVIDKRAVEEQI